MQFISMAQCPTATCKIRWALLASGGNVVANLPGFHSVDDTGADDHGNAFQGSPILMIPDELQVA